jgi:hypothetical protein
MGGSPIPKLEIGGLKFDIQEQARSGLVRIKERLMQRERTEAKSDST